MEPAFTRFGRQGAGFLTFCLLFVVLTRFESEARADSISRRQASVPVVVSAHCLAGCPRGGSSTNRVIHRRSHVLSHNRHTKFADWVAYVIRPASFGPSRRRVWRSDPDIPASETLEPDDYRGAHAGLGTDRGHLAPLAGFAGAPEWWVTNYLSNIAPQKSALNRGPWARLEQAIRKLATSPGVEGIHVSTGPLHERHMPKLPNADEPHLIPSGFWKLVAIGTPDKMEAIAFIMDQELARDADFCGTGQRVDLPSLERRTGLRLFPGLDDRAFAKVLESAPSMAARLGCDG